MSLFLVSLTTVLVTSKEGYDEAYKGRDACESAMYYAKEAAAEGSEKAYEACETTKRKAREAEAWETTKDKASEAADKGAKKTADAWETTKEVAAEGAEKAADTLEYAKEEGGKQASAYGGSLRRLPRRVQQRPATHGR